MYNLSLECTKLLFSEVKDVIEQMSRPQEVYRAADWVIFNWFCADEDDYFSLLDRLQDVVDSGYGKEYSFHFMAINLLQKDVCKEIIHGSNGIVRLGFMYPMGQKRLLCRL